MFLLLLICPSNAFVRLYDFSKKNPFVPPQAKVNLSRAFASKNYHQSNENDVSFPTFCLIFSFVFFWKNGNTKNQKNTITFKISASTHFLKSSIIYAD